MVNINALSNRMPPRIAVGIDHLFRGMLNTLNITMQIVA